MQERHHNPERYFEEQAFSAREYYLPYVRSAVGLGAGCRVLEVGSGWGGGLSEFARAGCEVTGVDIEPGAGEASRRFFVERGVEGTFVCCDFLEWRTDAKFDLIVLHDAIEHIGNKEVLMGKLRSLLGEGGVLYVGFPAWQMPFGGHQQAAKSRVLAHFPYVHLLPRWAFRALARVCGESKSSVEYFFGLRDTGLSVERFERLARRTGFAVLDRQLWFINPNYHVKFGLKPRRLWPVLARTPWLRNFFTTSCFYLLG